MKNTFKKVEINPNTISQEELIELKEEILVRNGVARFYSILKSKILVIPYEKKEEEEAITFNLLGKMIPYINYKLKKDSISTKEIFDGVNTNFVLCDSDSNALIPQDDMLKIIDMLENDNEIEALIFANERVCRDNVMEFKRF